MWTEILQRPVIALESAGFDPDTLTVREFFEATGKPIPAASDLTPDGVELLDRPGGVLWAWRRGERALGYRDWREIGHPILRLIVRIEDKLGVRK